MRQRTKPSPTPSTKRAGCWFNIQGPKVSASDIPWADAERDTGAPAADRASRALQGQKLFRESNMSAHLQPTGSAYFITKETSKAEKRTLAVLVDNEPGVLA